jgi:hypothetical protein
MSAAMAPLAKAEPLAFWQRFREQLESKIKEGNAVSGERLWRTTACSGSGAGVTIESVYSPSDRLDCAFDPRNGVLSFSSSSASRTIALRFEWVGGTADRLRRGRRELTIPETLNLLLDQLVWPDE